MIKPDNSPNANHSGGSSFFPTIKATQVKRPIPPSSVEKNKVGMRILRDGNIPSY